MDSTHLTVSILILSATLLVAGSMHAIVAALEQIPYASQRRLSESKRPDGKPTRVSRLASLPNNADNDASVVYSLSESAALVTAAVMIWALADDWSSGWPLILLLAIFVGAFLSLVVVRAVPRQIGRRYPEATVRALAPLGWASIRLTTPIRALFPALRLPELSEAEDIIEHAQDALDDEEVELLRSVVNLGDTLTREVMVPRTDMVTVNLNATLPKALQLFLRSGFSRVPVIGEDVDDLRGVLHFRDLVGWQSNPLADQSVSVEQVMREPSFVPESVPVDDLLRRMQNEVFHLAIVVDEYGGVSGLVTIEDALEEIVGEVTDEHDKTMPGVEELEDGWYRVPSRTTLNDLGELLERDLEDDDVDTIGGLLAKALGKVPILGSAASISGIEIVADRAGGRRRRLTYVRVRALHEEEDGDE